MMARFAIAWHWRKPARLVSSKSFYGAPGANSVGLLETSPIKPSKAKDLQHKRINPLVEHSRNCTRKCLSIHHISIIFMSEY